MNQTKLNDAVDKVRKKVLKHELFGEFFQVLLGLDMKCEAEHDEDFKAADISEIISGECLQSELRQLRYSIVAALKTELDKEYTYFMTTKIMLALWALSSEMTSFESKRVEFCYKFVNLHDYPTEEYDEVLQDISLLED